MNIFYTNVLNNRDIDKVIVLGSGLSILDLTKEEKEHINRCKYVIAFNKFMAFYQKAGILPTHVYFHDWHGNSLNFYKYILKICRRDRLTNLTFITNKEFAQQYKYFSFFRFNLFRIQRRIFHKKLSESATDWMGGYLKRKLFKYPHCSIIYNIEVTHYLKGGKWANSLNQIIFHYKGSLTSVLNICSIIFPKKDIFLVGTDFTNSSYFFEDEIEKLNFEWKDFTHQLVKDTGIHFSFQQTEGKTIEDAFPYIISSLKETENTLYCVNNNSMLIKLGVKYKPLI